MGKLIDLTGKRFGRLTVTGFSKLENRKSYWVCLCDCGNTTIVRSDSLKAKDGKNTVSCGCQQKENFTFFVDGRSKEKLYHVYYSILTRCNKENCSSYEYYGGRGIKCDFSSYEEFRSWALSNGYKEGLTIDRIDVNGNYSASNCRWVTMKEQNSNRRKYKNAITVVVNGKEKSLKDIAKELNLSYSAVYYRYSNNLPLEPSKV